MRYTPRKKINLPVKYIVRVREDENDQRTERTTIFLDKVDAFELQSRAEAYGFHAKVLKVLDRKRLERV